MALPAYTPFISYWVDLDAKQPDTYVLYLGQGGLGLPNRNYYLDDTPQMEEIRKNYIAYIATILKLAGENDVEKKPNKFSHWKNQWHRLIGAQKRAVTQSKIITQ